MESFAYGIGQEVVSAMFCKRIPSSRSTDMVVIADHHDQVFVVFDRTIHHGIFAFADYKGTYTVKRNELNTANRCETRWRFNADLP